MPATSDLNPNEPHIARMYDYYLGGKDHYQVDAEAAEKVLAALPAARVVYADNDPLVLTHARALMKGTPEGRTSYIQADATRPQEILDAARDTLDFDQPIGLSVIALMNFVPDAYEIIATLTAALAPGSHLVMTHLTGDFDPEGVAATAKVYRERGMHCHPRTKSEIARFFDGLELLDPGVVPIHRWRVPVEPPKSRDAQVPGYAAVARKP
ncbi:SAM-dependent methyltransferase [Nocardia vaccinii]|uniref:SAM-dependent methyltransferase n=1 Tax=Nocardia vaccinii TaxID=1822 RepID=UPI000831D3DB|nr:SAM-dependent methyltransferase [Nocardia vaccinii]